MQVLHTIAGIRKLRNICKYTKPNVNSANSRSRPFVGPTSASQYGSAQTDVSSGGPLCIQHGLHRRCYTRRKRVKKGGEPVTLLLLRHLTIERYPISEKNIPPTTSSSSSSHGDSRGGNRRGGLLLLLPRGAAEGHRRGEGTGPCPHRCGRDVLEGVLVRRGRWRRARGGGRLDSRAAEESRFGGRRRARVQVPVRVGGSRACGHRRRRRAGVRAQAAPRDRPQHRQDRQELPAGEDWGLTLTAL